MIPFAHMGAYIGERTVQAKFIRSLYFLNEGNLALGNKGKEIS
jgi:hypothetical protein